MSLISNIFNKSYTFRTWLRIHRNPWKKSAELSKIQDNMFRLVVKNAYENTAFYNKLYKQHGITPDSIRSLKDVSKLPLVTKKDLINCSIEERFSRIYNIRDCKVARTTGSTGTPFKVYLEPRACSYLTALHLRRLLIYGHRPWNTIVVFGPFWAEGLPYAYNSGFRKGIINMLDFDYNRLSLGENPVKNISYLRAIKPDVIWCPPSYLRLLAESVHELGVKDIKPRILICGAESLDRSTKFYIESIFDVDIFDEYGTVDVASRAIAWQCKYHKGYHINSDSVHLEFIKENEEVSAGEEGLIVATNLFRYATPMIRYVIGDIGVKSKDSCPCGSSFPMMDSIDGRSDDCLILPDGRIISPFMVINSIQDIPGIRRFRIIQDKIDKIRVLIEPITNFDETEKKILDQMQYLLGNEIKIEIVLGKIPWIRNKKFRAVTSKIVRP